MFKRDYVHRGSSGFEHVMEHERDQYGAPAGCHSWIYYYFLQEGKLKGKTVKYKGYAKNPMNLGPVMCCSIA